MFAFGQTSIQFASAIAAFSLGIAVAVSGWGVQKIRKGINGLVLQQSSEQPIIVKTGIVELDNLGQQLASSLQLVRQSSSAESHELFAIKSLLAKIDRRAEAIDRSGQPVDCATQLRGILKGYGGELDTNIRQTIACGREIFRATEKLVSGAEVQFDVTNQTTSFIEAMSSRIIAVCDTAEGALQSSTIAQETAQTGLKDFQELIDVMKQIRNHAAARERKLQVLGQHTKEIESIVQTIGSLSSRTDLLALNASIESVRAGEHGRGFAVVAEEVRALAEQSAQAVLDVTTRIEMIQLETHQSISVASGEHDQIHQVITKITNTLKSLQNVSEAVGNSATSLSVISKATHQQLQLTQDIVSNLERSTVSSKQNRVCAEGVHWTARTLAQVSTQLESSLELFQLSGALARATEIGNNPLPISNAHNPSPVFANS